MSEVYFYLHRILIPPVAGLDLSFCALSKLTHVLLIVTTIGFAKETGKVVENTTTRDQGAKSFGTTLQNARGDCPVFH